jgi:hypothetical protein
VLGQVVLTQVSFFFSFSSVDKRRGHLAVGRVSQT